MIKARSNSLEINERKNRWGEGDKNCQKGRTGGGNITENIKHMLIECPSNYNERREMEGEIKKK